VVLDNACGTGAAAEWLVGEFVQVGNRHFRVYATDRSAVMVNEVMKRVERCGGLLSGTVMDAQVCLEAGGRLSVVVEV
jgi:ubiquinone/menaquinone biosynthesis C-methylase UbiE